MTLSLAALGGLLVLFVYAFAFVLGIVVIKAVWNNGVQILRALVALFVLFSGLILAGCLMHAVEVAFQ